MSKRLIMSTALAAATVAFAAGSAVADQQNKPNKPAQAERGQERAQAARDAAEARAEDAQVIAEDAQDAAEEARERAEEQADERAEDAREAAESAADEHRNDGEHRQDAEHRADGEAVAAEARERGGPPEDGEAVSQGRAEKNPEEAKGNGKKRGWFGRLFGGGD